MIPGRRVIVAGAVAIQLAAIARVASAQVEVVVEPASVVLGSETEVRVRATIDGFPAHGVRWSTTLGRIESGGAADGDVARFDPGDRRTPGYAIVVATVPSPAGDRRGAAVLTLIGRGALPTHTTPGATVTVEIEGRSFGPLVADALGDIAVPVEVPPTARQARVNAVDEDGLSTTRLLSLPPVSLTRGSVLGPARLDAGQDATLTVFAIRDDGSWRRTDASAPRIQASSAALIVGEPRPIAPGRWDVGVAAAPDAAGGPVTLSAFIDGHAIEAVTVDVVAAPPPPPPPPPVSLDRFMGARAGAALGGGVTSGLAHIELSLPFRVRSSVFHVRAGVGVARGRDEDAPRSASLTHVVADVGVRMRLPIGGRFAFDLGAGLGLAWMSITIDEPAAEVGEDDGFAPLVYAAVDAAIRAGPGEIVLDLRYIDARFDRFRFVEGTSLGFAPTLGYAVAW
jgi:hypothetical protein